MLRSLKKSDIRTPDGDTGFWVMEQKAGNVSWQDVNSLVRPGVLRMFTYQLVSRGATAVVFFRWRQPRFGTEKFHGAVLPHTAQPNSRVFKEVAQLGDEMKLLAPALKDTQVVAETCILYSHDNDWALQQPMQPNRFFSLREHIQLFYTALHDRNIAVDFARPTEDLSRYKLVFAPSLHLLSGGEADRLKLYVQNGGTLVATFNTGLVDEHNIAPDTGYPHDLTDLFGLEVLEFDQLPPGEENHLTFKGTFPDHPSPSRQALVRSHRAEGLPDPGHLCEGLLRGPAGHDHAHVRPGQSHLHRHAEPLAFLRRPGYLAAPDVQPSAAAQGPGQCRSEHAPEG